MGDAFEVAAPTGPPAQKAAARISAHPKIDSCRRAPVRRIRVADVSPRVTVCCTRGPGRRADVAIERRSPLQPHSPTSGSLPRSAPSAHPGHGRARQPRRGHSRAGGWPAAVPARGATSAGLERTQTPVFDVRVGRPRMRAEFPTRTPVTGVVAGELTGRVDLRCSARRPSGATERGWSPDQRASSSGMP